MTKVPDDHDELIHLYRINQELFHFAKQLDWSPDEIELLRHIPFNRNLPSECIKTLFEFRMLVENKRTAKIEQFNSYENSKQINANADYMKAIGRLTMVIAIAGLIQALILVLTFLFK